MLAAMDADARPAPHGYQRNGDSQAAENRRAAHRDDRSSGGTIHPRQRPVWLSKNTMTRLRLHTIRQRSEDGGFELDRRLYYEPSTFDLIHASNATRQLIQFTRHNRAPRGVCQPWLSEEPC